MAELSTASLDPIGRAAWRSRFRRLRLPGAPVWLLVAAAFLFGVAGAAALFVGIWTKTAATGDRLKARQYETTQALQLARARAARVDRELAAAEASLRRARLQLRAQHAALQRAEHTAAARAAALARTSSRAAVLARDIRTLARDIEALDASIPRAGQGVDPGFLASQVSYLRRASRLAAQDAAKAVP